jgi:hypothetical protein
MNPLFKGISDAQAQAIWASYSTKLQMLVFAVPTSGSYPESLYCFDTSNDQTGWWRLKHATLTQGGLGIANSSGTSRLVGWTSDAKLAEIGTGQQTLAGGGLNSMFLIDPIDFGVGQEIDFRYVDALIEASGDITVSMEVDVENGKVRRQYQAELASSGVLLDDFILGVSELSPSAFSRVRQTIDQSGRSFGVQMTITGDGSQANIHTLGLAAQIKPA